MNPSSIFWMWENRERIVNLLLKMNKEFNTTIITVTHDLEKAIIVMIE